MAEEKLSEITASLVEKWIASNNEIIAKAAGAMCEHYQCKMEDLVLDRHIASDTQILRKEVPGLAYLIKRVEKNNEWCLVAEPIYLEKEYDRKCSGNIKSARSEVR